MKLRYILLPLTGLASLPYILAAAVPDVNEVQIDMSPKTFGVERVDSAEEKCTVYNDCTRCKPGYWRCCFAGCAGHELPGSHTCMCIQDGHDLGASCGCT